MGNENRVVVLLCERPTPFLAELADEFRKQHASWRMHVWFSGHISPSRGLHWLTASSWDSCSFQMGLEGMKEPVSIDNLLAGLDCLCVVSLLPLHPAHARFLRRHVKSRQLPLVFWHEPPLPRAWPIRMAKGVIYRLLARQLGFSALWAIGERALRFWRPITRCPAFVVPYFQSLECDTSGSSRKTPELQAPQVRFIFSGQLIPRNNVQGILSAAQELVDRGLSGKFVVRFFGDGPLAYLVDQAHENARNGAIEHLDYTPRTWIERLDPITQADVLLCPAHYSGWGLTIPEALSAGIPVISSLGVESARYYIRDGYNGVFACTDPQSIADAMEYFITNPERIQRAKEFCRESARPGSTEVGVACLCRLLDLVVSGKTKSV